MSNFLNFLIWYSLLGYYIIECAVTNDKFSGILSRDYDTELPVEVEQTRDNNVAASKISATNSNIDFENFPGELCNRACSADDQKICYFKFFLEHYQAMGVACGDCLKGNQTECNHPQCIVGDGFEKGVMSINRQIPGPAIQVCQNDRIIVDVVNMAGGTAASIHWHGLSMRATPWMDGVPFLTQCPIPFATTFRYQFVATEPGTQFYHSHAGHHKINGQYGALIIRQPKEDDRHSSEYDFDSPEHFIVISDWMHRYGEEIFPGLPSYGGVFPDSILINGRGTYIDNGERKSVPPSRFYVTSGKRYRFRVINSVSHACPVQFQVEDHAMTIIASDSKDIEPSTFDTIVTNAGERYDFVLETNQAPGDYWIRIKGFGVCENTDSVALLRYVTDEANGEVDAARILPEMPSFDDQYSAGVMLNYPNSNCFDGLNDHCITELSALDADDELRYATPDLKFYLGFNNYLVDNAEIFRNGHYPRFMNLKENLTYVGAINYLSLVFPDFPPLTQPENIHSSLFCDESNKPTSCDKNQLCPCVHRLKIPLGSIVEIVVVDESKQVGVLHHPFHLHGHSFMITGLGNHPDGVPMTVKLARELDKRRALPRSYFNAHPPWKDTVTIPSYGYGIFRFRANNPGYWLMHCHYEWHFAIGMGLIVQVGENDEMVPPPTDFPKCGNYLPDLLPQL